MKVDDDDGVASPFWHLPLLLRILAPAFVVLGLPEDALSHQITVIMSIVVTNGLTVSCIT